MMKMSAQMKADKDHHALCPGEEIINAPGTIGVCNKCGRVKLYGQRSGQWGEPTYGKASPEKKLEARSRGGANSREVRRTPDSKNANSAQWANLGKNHGGTE